jgi:hypothetical protein
MTTNTLIDKSLTPHQLKFIQAIARDMGLTDDAVQEQTRRLYGREVREMTRRQASNFIDRLQTQRGAIG